MAHTSLPKRVLITGGTFIAANAISNHVSGWNSHGIEAIMSEEVWMCHGKSIELL
jgi:hypothetical protein